MGRVSRAEFEAIVRDASENTYRVREAFVNGFRVEARISPQSGKGYWVSTYVFDPLTGDYEVGPMYRNSTIPLIFGDKIRQAIRAITSG